MPPCRPIFYRRVATAGVLLAWPELDALVCVSDELACGAFMQCQRRRIKVPDDLAVVGFGDSDVSRVCQPPLTTMAVPHRKIGSEAGRALLERLNQGKLERSKIHRLQFMYAGKLLKRLFRLFRFLWSAASFWRCGSSTAPAL